MATPDPRPNLLLITVDHWPGTHPPTVAGPVPHAPTLRQLSRLGTTFTRAYSACPICIPARRSLMTGTSARTHGDRVFNQYLPMPEFPTLAGCLSAAGYQCGAVGKLHVYPQRDPIGFDEVLLNEEGRRHLSGEPDDWEQALAQAGYPGEEYATGVNNNDYMVVPWHLPDHLHPTNWTARELSRMIQRRDPERPGFWYLSFTAPHPPLFPLRWYYDTYQDLKIEMPYCGEWLRTWDPPPTKCLEYVGGDAMRGATDAEIRIARRGFYALQTHIDHQIRVVLGTLREEGLLENTGIIFTSDHGDMLGNHGMWAKSVMYEGSARVPLLVIPPSTRKEVDRHVRDDRLAELRDVMPTLLEMAGVEIPPTVEGYSLTSGQRRAHLYGEHGEGTKATRMVVHGPHKLIYYAEGNRFQLFDLREDPREQRDLSNEDSHREQLRELQALLAKELYGEDQTWLQDGEFVGLPAPREGPPPPNFSFSGQRGLRR